MASLQEFLEVLGDAYPDEKVRGKEFEPFLRDALVASGQTVSSLEAAPSRSTPVRFTSVRFTPARSAPTRFASGSIV